MNLTLGSLFDGSGGFPLAGWLCGITPVWASEIEPYPIAVTRSRFPNMKHYGDISKINGGEIEPVNIICFGSPCQGLSVAGLRKGLEDSRSGLFMEAIRIIKEMRRATNGTYPRFALFENVPGIFSSGTPKGEDFRIVLEEFIKIAEEKATMPPPPKGGWPYADAYVGDGWSVAYRTFDTQYWGKSILDPSGRVVQKGTPQRRRRLHLIADFAGGCAPGILFEHKGLRGDLTPCRTPRQGTAAHAERCIGADDREGKTLIEPCPASEGDVSATPYAAHGTKWNGNAEAYEGENFVSEKWSDQPNTKQHLFENHWKDARHSGPLDICTTLPAYLGTGGNNTPLVLENHEVLPPVGLDGYNSTLTGETSSTLGVNCGMSTGRNGVLIPYLLKIRSGCEGGGKGPLWQADKSHTISTHNDQYLFQPLALSDVASTLRSGAGAPKHESDFLGRLVLEQAEDPQTGPASEHNDPGESQINVQKNVKQAPRSKTQGDLPIALNVDCFDADQDAANRPSLVISVDQGGGKSSANFHLGVSPTLTCTHGGEPVVSYLANGKDKAGTLMANCGTNHWLGNQEAFRDNYHITEEYSQPPSTEADLILDDQGGQQISVHVDGKCPTLRAEMHGNIPCVLKKEQDNQICDAVSGIVSDEDQAQVSHIAFAQNQRNEVRDLKNVAGALAAQAGMKQQTYVCELHCMSNGQANAEITKDISPTLTCEHEQQIVFEGHQFGGYREGCGSLRASGGDFGGGSENLVVKNKPYYIVRRLTPVECARLQGFPDSWGYP